MATALMTSYLNHDLNLTPKLLNQIAPGGMIKTDPLSVLAQARKLFYKPFMVFAVGPDLPTYAANNLLHYYLGRYHMKAVSRQSIQQATKNLLPGEENTLLIYAHGLAVKPNGYNRWEWRGSFETASDTNLYKILEAVEASGSSFTHIIFSSCQSGQIVEDFMRLREAFPELTERVNIYLSTGNYQTAYIGGSIPTIMGVTSGMKAALYAQRQLIKEGQGIGGKVIIDGKVYDPLKESIQILKEKKRQGTITADQKVLLKRLEAVRAILTAGNPRKLYKAILNYQKLYPKWVTIEYADKSAPFSFTSNLPSSYLLTTNPYLNTSGLERPRYKILITQDMADFVEQTAKTLYSTIPDRENN